MMQYTVITKTSYTVEAEWIGNRIRLITYGAHYAHWQAEWCYTLDYAVHRFNWLIEHNGGMVL